MSSRSSCCWVLSLWRFGAFLATVVRVQPKFFSPQSVRCSRRQTIACVTSLCPLLRLPVLIAARHVRVPPRPSPWRYLCPQCSFARQLHSLTGDFEGLGGLITRSSMFTSRACGGEFCHVFWFVYSIQFNIGAIISALHYSRPVFYTTRYACRSILYCYVQHPGFPGRGVFSTFLHSHHFSVFFHAAHSWKGFSARSRVHSHPLQAGGKNY